MSKQDTNNIIAMTLAALLSGLIISSIYIITKAPIQNSEQQAIYQALNHILDPKLYNNDPLLDAIVVNDPLLGDNQDHTIYIARLDGKPVAIVLTIVTTKGYNGIIKLLVGIYITGELSGVRVIAHQETPGLGDKMEPGKSNWIYAFDHKSLVQPPAAQWTVAKDGGAFDQWTGATITPRAIVRAVAQALQFFEQNKAKFNDEKPQ